ncbi:MAG: hypothetical protein CVT48_04575 [Thermoplasmata archaeon HGW-Thermoplasmata-1]|nr:MAG: hypothetical protein CVT48_04575 [Thermoplasmata archaeon HGW-Thermoplasmata-1]
MDDTAYGTTNRPWDILISGSGPSGLAAGIAAARRGMTVCICEKAAHPGPMPRGETVHDHPIFTELLGEGFMESISLHATEKRRYNSPCSLKQLDFVRSTPSIVFRWEEFICRLYENALGADVTFRFGCKVVSGLIGEDGVCRGVELSPGGRIYARTVLACDGHGSSLGRQSGVCYGHINLPTVKRLASGFNGDYPGFEFFFITQGMLDYAPRFPPAVIFVFPRESGHCETGMTVFTRVAESLCKKCDIPSREETLRVWKRLVLDYPRFSELMKGTKIELEYYTELPNAKLHEPPMAIPGLALIGDSAGFIEASGGSGISSSLQEAAICAEFLSQADAPAWDEPLVQRFNKHMTDSGIYRHIRKVYRLIGIFQQLFFGIVRTAKGVNRNWWLLKLLMPLQ